jgi:pentose-5-phosphate-3-epimerase
MPGDGRDSVHGGGVVRQQLPRAQRTTQDVDLVIDPTSEQLEQFLAAASEQFFVSAEAARDALTRRSLDEQAEKLAQARQRDFGDQSV